MERLPGVGPRRLERLGRLGIRTVEELLRHAPRGYEDRGDVVSAARAVECPPGSFACVRGEVVSRRFHRSRGRRSTLRARVRDDSGTIEALWFNAPFLAGELSRGSSVCLAGRLGKGGVLLQPELARPLDDGSPPERLTGIRPLYPLTAGVSRRLLQDLVSEALPAAESLEDALPEDVRERVGVLRVADAVRWAHRPRTAEEARAGQDRLLFDEILPLELQVQRRARVRRLRAAPAGAGRRGGAERFVASLPFSLSPSQKAAVAECVADLSREHPMQRMIFGEVGSGKTVVALAAIQEARSQGLQCALLAPTDTLARQHYRTLSEILGPDARAVLLTGSLPGEEARSSRDRLASGNADLAVGTHALLSAETRFPRLGLVIVDEQHRFGVEQRSALLRRARTPHCAVLTATPIPRSLALLGFGDCDLSALEPRPGARGEVETLVVPAAGRAAALALAAKRVREGQQGFFVRPRIEGPGQGARELRDELARGVLSGERVALVHGRLSAVERESALESFRTGEVRALVATTVIEVGLDVPGAAVLWVEGAERLGLATLHQLRGRVARRGQRGYCWIVESAGAPPGSLERLETLARVQDGMRLAEIDLMVRGPGELLGVRQSGRTGILAGLGPDAGTRLADLAERATRAACWLLDAEEAGCSPMPVSSSLPQPSW